ncbi:hypothetical protein KCH_23700 [Kitasatospora cheerisanensis KCTC 2395]|uniref:Uncharacterized protein n=1 Tax=Kitasatospora cheerisanensis KCTC 2395 TaxID=1348663 RepID=A0A066Z0V2_9ACTN|nr:hypothetical protein KCH_23700 [Kitasatospora cheerisanensis KCTC 2395]
MNVVLGSLDASRQLRTRITDRDLQPVRSGGQEDIELSVSSIAPMDDRVAGQLRYNQLGIVHDDIRVAPLAHLATDSSAHIGDGVRYGAEALVPGERIGGLGWLAGHRAHRALL